MASGDHLSFGVSLTPHLNGSSTRRGSDAQQSIWPLPYRVLSMSSCQAKHSQLSSNNTKSDFKSQKTFLLHKLQSIFQNYSTWQTDLGVSEATMVILFFDYYSNEGAILLTIPRTRSTRLRPWPRSTEFEPLPTDAAAYGRFGHLPHFLKTSPAQKDRQRPRNNRSTWDFVPSRLRKLAIKRQVFVIWYARCHRF